MSSQSSQSGIKMIVVAKYPLSIKVNPSTVHNQSQPSISPSEKHKLGTN